MRKEAPLEEVKAPATKKVVKAASGKDPQQLTIEADKQDDADSKSSSNSSYES